MDDLRGEMEMVNSKSEEEDDEKEWEGEDGSVYDIDDFASFGPLLFPISLFLYFLLLALKSDTLIYYLHGIAMKYREQNNSVFVYGVDTGQGIRVF